MIEKSFIEESVVLKEAESDKYVPDDFYSTTNHTTIVFYNNKWLTVRDQRMDGVIVMSGKYAVCKKLRDVKKGDCIVCGDTGVKAVYSTGSEAEQISFGFMSNGVSSERRAEHLIESLAHEIGVHNKKLTIVAGPVVVHTGGDSYLAELIRRDHIQSLLTGNAVAVHDIEKSLFGTSLGVCAKSGKPTPTGHRNHMRAINQVMRYGSIRGVVDAGRLKSGVMYECVRNDIPFVLAGSLRDDGPLPDTITDMVEAQNAYNEHLKNADIVLILGSMLHGIAAGNMLPARVQLICVDINPSVVTKLGDRGSSQTVGIVTDVGLFLNILIQELNKIK